MRKIGSDEGLVRLGKNRPPSRLTEPEGRPVRFATLGKRRSAAEARASPKIRHLLGLANLSQLGFARLVAESCHQHALLIIISPIDDINDRYRPR